MALDPVERVKVQSHETPIIRDLPSVISRLATLRPSIAAPYLTICLDWRPQGEAPGSVPAPELKRSQMGSLRNQQRPIPRRPAREIIEQRFQEIIERYEPHTPAHESLTADFERTRRYLDGELDPSAHGAVIIANQYLDVFVPVPLDVPVETGAKVGPIPSLRALVHAAEDYPPYAVVVAEQRQAAIWLIERLSWVREIGYEASDYPRHQKQGGWSQRRYQMRADERVEHVAKTIAEDLRRTFVESPEAPEYLVIAADEPMYSALMSELHETVRARIVGRIAVGIEASINDVIDLAQPLVLDAERKRELAAVQAAHDGRAAGGKGVEGPEETLTALQAGQVLKLVMNDDYSQPGWADYTMPIFGVGPVPRAHPAGGDVANLMETALEDEMIRLALLSSAEIELVRSAMPVTENELADVPKTGESTRRTPAALALDRMGGVAAELRFALDAGQSTANLWSNAGQQTQA